MEPVEEATARKQRSERWLSTRGIPFLERLPPIESTNEARLRSPSEVARRIRVLFGVAAVGYADSGFQAGVSPAQVVSALRDEGSWPHATRQEQSFLTGPRSKRAVTDATWAIEAVWTLQWALELVGELDLPTSDTKPSAVLRLMPGLLDPVDGWLGRRQTVRPVSSILDEADRAYRLHWAVRHWPEGEKCPLLADAVVERHRALNWLISADDADWDEVPTDT